MIFSLSVETHKKTFLLIGLSYHFILSFHIYNVILYFIIYLLLPLHFENEKKWLF